MSGVGGMALAAQEMARVQRQLRDHLLDSRVRRDERYVRLRAMAPPITAPERFEGHFYFLCEECGYLSETHDEPCHACGSEAWIDLGHQATALDLREYEERQRDRSPWRVRLILALALLVFFAPIVWFVLMPMVRMGDRTVSRPIMSAVLALPFYLLAFAFLLRPFTVWMLRYWPPRPHRWRLPLNLPTTGATPRRIVEGQVDARGEDLVAPFSAWPCLACRIRVLFFTPGDARPPEWVLDEMLAQDLQVGDQLVTADRILITGPFEALTPDALGVAEEDLTQFLLERGLFSTDGQFTLFEARIDADQQVRASFHGPDRAVRITQIQS